MYGNPFTQEVTAFLNIFLSTAAAFHNINDFFDHTWHIFMDFDVMYVFECYLIPFIPMNTRVAVRSLTFCDTSTFIEVNFAFVGRRFRL